MNIKTKVVKTSNDIQALEEVLRGAKKIDVCRPNYRFSRVPRASIRAM